MAICELESAKFSPITTALLRDHAIFDFATEYHYSNEMTDWNGFTINDAVFQDFIKYLKKNGFDYETESEKKFEEAEIIKQDVSKIGNRLDLMEEERKVLQAQEMLGMFRNLMRCNQPQYDLNGKPTFVLLNSGSLDKLFEA